MILNRCNKFYNIINRLNLDNKNEIIFENKDLVIVFNNRFLFGRFCGKCQMILIFWDLDDQEGRKKNLLDIMFW